jgi:hypothetical protein
MQRIFFFETKRLAMGASVQIAVEAADASMPAHERRLANDNRLCDEAWLPYERIRLAHSRR